MVGVLGTLRLGQKYVPGDLTTTFFVKQAESVGLLPKAMVYTKNGYI